MIAQALLESPHDADGFQRHFAWKLRWWLASAPAGVGFATLRAILKLWIGFPRNASGVYSAGNGPAMRSALLGVYFAESPEQRREFVRASAHLTHRDPRAEIAAAAVAETAALLTNGWDGEADLFAALESLSDDAEWLSLATHLRAAICRGQSVSEFAQTIGAAQGVSGYAYQTVPVAIYAAVLHRDDFAAALTAAIACGGDTDTVGAIVGALVGTRLGVAGIPSSWRTGIIEWPRSLALLERVAVRLHRQQQSPSGLGGVSYFWQGIPVRNLVFLAIVLAHGFRRLFPP
jgi:ADP-ribosyl-[dinitrogen reductase] hydrolase